MILSNKKGVQHIVFALANLGLKEVVIAPGSRNSPLTISFNRHGGFNCTSIRDERSAAFFALGKTIELQEPVAILCTSGSAALNFAPAIVEAFYQRLPLIVLTADRPPEWINQGDGQTINQTNIYNNYIRKSFDINGDAKSSSELWQIEKCLSEAWAIATQLDKGPVHLNIPMNEPLYETEDVEIISPKIFLNEPVDVNIDSSTLKKIGNYFSSTDKVMILVGQQLKHEKLEQLLIQLAHFKNVVVLTESTSNCHHQLFVENIDRCITNLKPDEAEKLMPDLLLTIGGAVVSKRIKSLLRKYKPKQHWNIDTYDSLMDTYQSLTKSIAMSAQSFFQQIIPFIQANQHSSYNSNWQTLQTKKETLHYEFCNDVAFSDFKVFKNILEKIPDTISLHVGNSSPIRYVQLFDNSKIFETWSNRGTSGIDGCTSTVMGAASANSKKQFLLITGDVSFQYDINAFWNNLEIENVNVILINNGGGGIFRIIDGPNTIEERSVFLETSMTYSAEHIAAHFKWNYLSANDEQSLNEKLNLLFERTTKRTILEVFTNADLNPEILKKYWNFLNK